MIGTLAYSVAISGVAWECALSGGGGLSFHAL